MINDKFIGGLIMDGKKSVVKEKSFAFALRIIELYKFLKEHREFVISRQLLKSGTSPGANIEEAEGAYSKREFTAKMSIALKEIREARYWLTLLQYSQLVANDYQSYIVDASEIIAILTKIVKTSQSKKIN